MSPQKLELRDSDRSYSLALVFFLLLHRKKLKIAFWDFVEHLFVIYSGRRWGKNCIRLLSVAVAFISLKTLIIIHPYDQNLKGSAKLPA